MNTKRGRNRGLPILFVVVMLLFLACSETDLVATGCEPSCLLGQACVDGVCTTDDVGAPLFDGVVQVNGGVDGGADAGSVLQEAGAVMLDSIDDAEPAVALLDVAASGSVDGSVGGNNGQDTSEAGGGLTIKSIQSGLQSTSCAWPKTNSIKGSQSVTLEEVVVTVNASGLGNNGSFMVRAKSDAPANGEYGGIHVVVLGVVPLILAGNILRLTGTLTEYYCETQLVIQGTAGIEALGHQTPPLPYPVMVEQITQDKAFSEPFEGVYVRIDDVEVANPNMLGSDGKNHGQFTVRAKGGASTDLVQVGWGPKTSHTSKDAKTGEIYSKFKQGQVFTSITGHLSYYFGSHVLRPFSDADLVLQ